MIDKEFLKKIDILYVEDDDVAREKLGSILKRLFKNVYLASNGEEGFLIFQKLLNNKTPVDLILSDINMPKMSGLEMLEQIRELDENIPFIFTTARSESENLLQAIKLNVNHYILKPVDIQDIILKSQEICQQLYLEKMIASKNQEVKEYLHTIENIAYIFKMDKNGNIYYSNNSFLEELGILKNEEHKKLNFFDLIHPDTSIKVIEDIKNSINMQQRYEENIKFINIEEEPFYLNSTLFKIDEHEKEHYINIGFLTTKESLEKREFKKKVIKNIHEHNIKEFELKQEVQTLKSKVEKYEQAFQTQVFELDSFKKKNMIKEQQIEHYENKMLELNEKKEKTLKLKNSQLEEYKEVLLKMKNERALLLKKTKKQEDDILAKRVDLEKKEEIISLKKQRIKNLEEIIKEKEPT